MTADAAAGTVYDAEPAPGRLARGVAELFGEVLGRDRCGTDDSFFRLSGTSLAAMRIIARMDERYGVRLALADVFDYPTPALLAERLMEAGAAAPGSRNDAPPPIPADRPREGVPYRLALSQEGFHAMSMALDGAPFFNIVGGLRFTGDVDPAAVRSAVRMVARRQAALRTRFDVMDGIAVQYVEEASPAVAEFDLRTRAAERLRRLLDRQHTTGFHLAEGPPVRFTLAQLADDDWALVWTVHHLLFDGVSDGLLVEELGYAYRAAIGMVPERAPLAFPYVDFAEWQRVAIPGERLAAAVDAAAPVLRTPAARIEAGPSGGYRTRLEELRLAPPVAAGLRARAAEQEVSVFVMLLAAVTDFVARRTGRSRQCVTVQAANRRRPGTENTIGCFANMLLVESGGAPGMPRAERVQAVRAGLTRALEHEEVPIESVLRRLAERGVAVADGMPGMGFLVQPDRMAPVDLSGCRVARLPADPMGDFIDPSVFPLMVELTVGPDGMVGTSHRIIDAWPGDSFPTALGQLLASFERFSAGDGGDGAA